MASSKYTMTFDVEEQEYILLAPGEYEFTIDSVNYGDYNGSTKIPACGMVTVNMHVDTEKGRSLLSNRFYVCKECSGLIAAFFKSVGDLKDGQRTFTPDWDALAGKKGIVKTSQREYNGNIYNQIDRFLPPKKQVAKKATKWSQTEW